MNSNLAPLYVSAQIFFIESVCDDPDVIASNIMVSRRHGDRQPQPSAVTLVNDPPPTLLPRYRK